MSGMLRSWSASHFAHGDSLPSLGVTLAAGGTVAPGLLSGTTAQALSAAFSTVFSTAGAVLSAADAVFSAAASTLAGACSAAALLAAAAAAAWAFSVDSPPPAISLMRSAADLA